MIIEMIGGIRADDVRCVGCDVVEVIIRQYLYYAAVGKLSATVLRHEA
jgi:hypothetical protein